MPFHVSLHIYSPGDIIQRGWFGRNICNEPVEVQIREYFYEIARLQVSPRSPCRFRSCFFFDALADAQAFRQCFRQGTGTIYQVDLIDPNAPTHRHCVTAAGVPHLVGGQIHAQGSLNAAQDFWLAPAIYQTNTEAFAETDLLVL
ncbi:MAG: hypothetical protein WCZ23_00345 [Rhodospirillaceae bacterium]